MRKLFQLVAVIAVLMALPLPPVASCLFAGDQQSPAAHACCHKMKISCGSGHQPVSQGCCADTSISDHTQAIPSKAFSLEIANSASGIPVVFALSIGRSTANWTQWASAHPPGQVSSSATHLRI